MLDTPNTHSGHPWTDEAIAKLKELWGAGKSASECARILDIGVSRSAVIGKVHRLNLSKRDNSIRAKPPAHRNRAPKAVRRSRSQILEDARTRSNFQHKAQRPHGNKGQPKANAIVAKAVTSKKVAPLILPVPTGLPDVTERIGLMDLGRNDCRYCNGDPMTADHSFCGRPVRPGSSWCPDHHRRVFPASASLD